MIKDTGSPPRESPAGEMNVGARDKAKTTSHWISGAVAAQGHSGPALFVYACEEEKAGFNQGRSCHCWEEFLPHHGWAWPCALATGM